MRTERVELEEVGLDRCGRRSTALGYWAQEEDPWAKIAHEAARVRLTAEGVATMLQAMGKAQQS